MLIPWQAPDKHLSLHLLQTTEQEIKLYLQLTKRTAFCPSCGTQSKKQHSFYPRKLQDLSTGIQHIQIYLQSRKWFCAEAFCTQQIFTERFTWLQPYARRTERLQNLLKGLVFSMSCRQAERVIQLYMRRISHDTFLRLCFAIKKCRELQRKIQNVATRYFPYFLDNAFVKRKLWPVYEIIWAW